MNVKHNIVKLDQHHDRSKFDCGVDELNQYLKNIASQHIAKGLSQTFVLIDDNIPTEILGFYTLVFGTISVERINYKYFKGLPLHTETPFPVAKLGRLAVTKNRQRQGLGKLMMVNAIERTLMISHNIGIIGFFVDAKNENAKAYYESFGFISLPDNPLELFIPIKTLQQAYNPAQNS